MSTNHYYTCNRKSKIITGSSFVRFRDYISSGKIDRAIIITDENINRIYGKDFKDFPVIEIPAGENSKGMATITSIVQQLLNLNADRHSFLLAIGGGVVCDITGFVASVFMRGISFAYISTSLLSQVDASIGGKTGINFNDYKNIIGTFNHPSFVICDQTMLMTLPQQEFINGLGEVVKHAIIADAEMFKFLETQYEQILARETTAIKYLIEKSIQIKSSIVDQDEKEQGLRKVLNFGHTLGHAIEMNSNFNHGESVSIGMVLAAKLSYKMAYCSKAVVNRIESLLLKLSLPVSCNIPVTVLEKAIVKDKKKKGQGVDFIYIDKIGKTRIERTPIDKIIDAFD